MSYIKNTLVAGETILYQGLVSRAIFISPLLFFILITWFSTKLGALAVFIDIIFGIYLFLNLFLTIITTEFALTNQRIIAKRGVLRQHSLEIMLAKIESIAVSQSISGRLFGYGTVIITGSGGTHETFPFIDDPLELRKQINQQISSISSQG